MEAITKEDLLLKISKLKAQNSLMKSKLLECGKEQSYISELEHRIEELGDQKRKLNQKVQDQCATINTLKTERPSKLDIASAKVAKKELMRESVIEEITFNLKAKIKKQNETIRNMRKSHSELLAKYLEYKRILDG